VTSALALPRGNYALVPAYRRPQALAIVVDTTACGKRGCGGEVVDDGPRAGDGLRVRRCTGPCGTVEGYSESAFAQLGPPVTLRLSVSP
jgi:hypothetical protein